MTLKQTALTLALGLGFLASANATVVDRVTALGVINATAKLTNFATFSPTVFGDFSDVYTFSIPKLTFSSGTVTSSEFADVWGITGLNVDLYAGKYGDGIDDGKPLTLTGTATSKTGYGNYTVGDYYYVVTGTGNGGTATGIGEGGYGVSVFAKVSPVPEPESYAMLLAGLGLMGTIARRRNKAKAA